MGGIGKPRLYDLYLSILCNLILTIKKYKKQLFFPLWESLKLYAVISFLIYPLIDSQLIHTVPHKVKTMDQIVVIVAMTLDEKSESLSCSKKRSSSFSARPLCFAEW